MLQPYVARINAEPIVWTRLIIFFIVAGFSLFVMFRPGAIDALNQPLEDALMQAKLSDATPRQITVIDIDDASIEQLGDWPWPRDVIAQLVGRIFSQHTPKALALDMVFPQRRDQSGDAKLANLIEQHPICLAIAFDLTDAPIERASGQLPQGREADSGHRAIGYIANHALLSQAAQCQGHITPLLDEDGKVRRLPKHIAYQGQSHVSLAQAMYEHTHNRQPPTPNIQDRDLTIPYHTAPNAWRTITAQDILFERLPAGALDGQYIFLGSSAMGLSDRVITPVHPWLPGVIIHAQLMQGWLSPQPDHATLLNHASTLATLVFLLVLSVSFFVLQTRSLPIWVTVLGALFALGWLVFLWLYWHRPVIAPIALPLAALAFIIMLQLPIEWLHMQRRNHRLTSRFRQYLPATVVDELVKREDPDVLAPQKRQITVLFADIANYTKLSRQLPAEDIAQLTRQVLTILTDAIHKNHGTLDKYIGDEVMAFWNAPLAQARHVDMALSAAIDMQSGMKQFNLQSQYPPLLVRIGIHTGWAMTGDLGTNLRHTYTAVGDTVNIAHRLHDHVKDLRLPILISKDVAEQAMAPPEYIAEQFAVIDLTTQDIYQKPKEAFG
ncbi:MAG: CHASE2 domain-containing protein [Hydrogenovibrio sp.]|uniref:CHASE2 domain-containing protein n=1 Tax=Hydrogenovibrio sp. TaxID=2065821 RepID=UPI00286FFC52|nr:CHASE2 domain-containing protein [Hydrogenovibrio sp.]MDR9499884.1 CHASE2 domain-containing protein [Hydrogenovibrio sp.]